MRNTREAGFSLVEVLVAVAVFAAVSAIATGLLAGALRSKAQGEDALERLASVQRTAALLREDIGQLSRRAVRDADGLIDPRIFAADAQGVQAVRGGAQGREILVLTRTGWANPGGVQPRSTLQRVSWGVEDGVLYREVRAYPDAAPGSQVRRQRLIEGVGNVRIDVLARGSWVGVARIVADGETAAPLPEAVRLRYELEDRIELEHVALSPSAEAL